MSLSYPVKFCGRNMSVTIRGSQAIGRDSGLSFAARPAAFEAFVYRGLDRISARWA